MEAEPFYALVELAFARVYAADVQHAHRQIMEALALPAPGPAMIERQWENARARLLASWDHVRNTASSPLTATRQHAAALEAMRVLASTLPDPFARAADGTFTRLHRHCAQWKEPAHDLARVRAIKAAIEYLFTQRDVVYFDFPGVDALS